MSETTPFPGAGAAPQPAAPPPDPLAGDWADGLRGPARALGIAEPKLLSLEGLPPPAPPARPAVPEPPRRPPAAEEVEAPDAWGVSEDPLQSQPPPVPRPPEPPPSVIANITGAFQAPSFRTDVTAPPTAANPDLTPTVVSFRAEAAPPPTAPAEFKAEITPALAVPAPLIPPPALAAPPEGVVEQGAADAAAAPAESVAAPAEPVMELRAEDAAAADAPPASHAWETPAPTPWSEPAQGAAAETAWDAPPPVADAPVPLPAAPAAHEGEVVATEDVIWSAPPPTEHVTEEWKPEAAPSDWEELKKPEPPPAAAAADWSTLSTGPDWSAPPAAEAPADDAWGAPPPPPTDDAWGAPPPTPAADEWAAAPAEPAADEWSAPPPPAPDAAPAAWEPPAPDAGADWMAPPPEAPAKSWGGPPVGASALEQLESEPQEPTPGAAQELFGSVPAGGSLAGDGPEGHADFLHPPEAAHPPAEEPVDLGPPEELASPEDVLKPVEMSDDDVDLLVPVEEEEPEPQPAAQPLAMMPPVNPLEVRGEHRVAVHLRRGGTKRGSVKDVDLARPQFPLLPQGGGAAESVYHADVKAIFFMLAPGEKVQPGDGRKVRVTFADGRSIEGVRDGADAKPGFFFVPADAARTNTRRIYVARDATSEIEEI